MKQKIKEITCRNLTKIVIAICTVVALTVSAFAINNPKYNGKWIGAGFNGKSYLNINYGDVLFKRVFIRELSGFADGSPSLVIKADKDANTTLTFTFNSCVIYNSVEDNAIQKGTSNYVVAQGQGFDNKYLIIDNIQYNLSK